MEGVSILQLTSLTTIVTASIFLTWVAKRSLASVPIASKVPVWIYTGAIAAVLTYVANRVTGTLEGQTGVLMIDAVINGALASGIREWFTAGTKPLESSGTAREAIMDKEIKNRLGVIVLPFLLAGSLLATSCGGLTPGSNLPTQPTEAQQAAINQKAVEFAEIGKAVVGLSQQTLELAHKVVPPSELRLEINAAASDFGHFVKGAAERAKTIVTDLSLRTFARELLAGVDAFLGAITKSGHAGLAEYASKIQDAVRLVRAFGVGGVQ